MWKTNLNRIGLQLLVVAMALAATSATAQNFPSRSIRILTSEAGGGTDRMMRLMAPKASDVFGQPVIVENRPSSTTGAVAAKLPPDGYTVITIGTTILLAPLYSPQEYDPIKDFAPVTLALSSPFLLIANPDLPIRSVKELIALAKAKPGEMNYATTGVGSAGDLAGELFKSLTGINSVRVNYKGTAPALRDVVAGQVQFSFEPPGAVMPLVKSGKLRALGVTSLEPSSLIQGVPTVASSVPGFEMSTKTGLVTPAKTPAPIIKTLNQAFLRVLGQADIKEQALANGVEALGSSPEEYGEMMKSDMAKVSKLMKDAGIQPEAAP